MTTTATLTGATLQLDLENAPEVEHRPSVMLAPNQAEIIYAPDRHGALAVTVTLNGRTRRKDGLLGEQPRWVRYQPGHLRAEWVQKLVNDNVPDILRAALEAGADGQRSQAARRTALQDAQECTCVVSCADDPATACSHSGVLHVHPAGPVGTFGPCPVHPDAPGDL
ncbi:hypothetical protein [Streptacidiphilus sp. EB103A]|uniref:hypothetical protein n=1 Tax=Streptacidiphilus sp. EB103A TaxID=3156275 RepID=UPI003515E2C8